MERKKRRFLSFFIILSAAALVNALFLITYQLDNKYTSTAPRGYGGSLAFKAGDLNRHPLIPLVDGWELTTGGETETVFIGQYPNFSHGEPSASPDGSGCYRLTIEADQPLLLYLPEIYSASRISVNGKLTVENGALAPYRPMVRCITLPLEQGHNEITVEAAGFGFYYAGMTYPPVLGTPEAVSQMLSLRDFFYGFLCFFTLGVSLAFLTVWFVRRGERLYLYFGLLCLCFTVCLSYPFWAGLGISVPALFYALMDTAWHGVLLFAICIVHSYTGGVVPRPVRRLFLWLGLVFCLLPVLTAFVIFPAAPKFSWLYGQIISAGKIMLGLYLLASALAGCLKGKTSPWLLAGSSVFGLGLLADYLTAGLYEPLYFGWQTEYCGFFLVLLFLGMMARQNARILKENNRLALHLQEEVALKSQSLQKLLQERKQFLSSVAHDLKAPVSVIQIYADFIREGGVAVDEETKRYLDAIQGKAQQMQNQLKQLQQFNLESAGDEPYEAVDLNLFLQNTFEETKPYTDAEGIYYRLCLPRQTVFYRCQPQRLYRTLENIVLNATAYTPADGTIKITAEYSDAEILLTIADTGRGIAKENLPKLFDYRFSTENPRDHLSGNARGLGLYFVKLTVMELKGDISVQSTLGSGTAFFIRLPMNRK